MLLSDAEVHEEVSAMSSASLELLRIKAEQDLYVFSKGILGMAQMNERLHKPLCRAVESDGVADPTAGDTGRYDRFLRQLYLLSRGHLKTSVITVADSMRRAVRNPEERILFGNEIWDNSVAFVDQIKQYFDSNAMVRLLWPHVIPDKTAGPGSKWSGTGLTLVRKGSYREPTFFPIGVGGAITSKHFTLINLDDLIGLDAFESPAAMRKAIGWNNNVEPLVVNSDTTIIRWIGTRWLGGDLYEDIIDGYGTDLYMFHRGPRMPDGTLYFPEMISEEFLLRMQRKDPARYAAQYLNDPTSGYVADFEYERIKSFYIDPQDRVRFYHQGEEHQLEVMSELDRVLVVDPNSGKASAPDEAAISVTGQGPSPDAYVFSLESYAGRPNPDELIAKTLELYRKWRPRVVGVEEAGQQAVVIFNLKKKFHEEGLPSSVIEALSPGNVEKEKRIRGLLQPVISDFRYFVPESQMELRTSLKKFPGVKLFDRLDAAAYCIKLLRPPASASDMAQYRKATKLILSRRNRYTGY